MPKQDNKYSETAKCTIQVYMENGTVFEYETLALKAREHIHAIVQTGYVSVRNGNATIYPPHKISKVVAKGNQFTNYTDVVRGT
jgi:hypothetical protein